MAEAVPEFEDKITKILRVRGPDRKAKVAQAYNEVLRMQALIDRSSKWFGQGSTRDLEQKLIDYRHMLFRKKVPLGIMDRGVLAWAVPC